VASRIQEERAKGPVDVNGNRKRTGAALNGRVAKQARIEEAVARKAATRAATRLKGFNPLKEDQLMDAVYHKKRHPDISYRDVARLYGIPELYYKIQRRIKGQNNLLANGGQLRHFSDIEEDAILLTLDRYQYIGAPLRLDLLRSVANRMLRDRCLTNTPTDEIPTVGRDWPRNFVDRHSDGWKLMRLKYLDVNRKAAHKKEDLRAWFELYDFLCEDFGIPPANRWNMDESGFRVGVLEIRQMVITRKEVRACYMANPEVRTLVTSCECISGDGKQIPPGVIFPGKVFVPWMYPGILPPDWLIGYSDKGYNTAELGLGWLKHFDKHTKRLMEPDNPEWKQLASDLKDEVPVKEGKPGQYRLLLIDGHESHINVDFLDYAERQDIIVLVVHAQQQNGPLPKVRGTRLRLFNPCI
jgi:hypothetical protein